MQGGEIETGGRFIKQQSGRVVNEGSRNKQPPRFSGGQFVEPPAGEKGGVESLHDLRRLLFHRGRDMVIGPDADAAEEARKNQLEAPYVACARGHQIVADYADMRAKLENIPGILAENAKRTVVAQQRVTFAGDRFYECRFSAAVGAENGYVLASFDFEIDAIKGVAISAKDVNVCEAEERRGFRHP